MDFALTGIEMIFLGVAALVTVPMALWIRWIFLELKKEERASESGQDPSRPDNP